MGTITHIVARLIRTLLVVAGGLALLIAALVATAMYMNGRAHDDAAALCARIVTGSPETAAVALGRDTRARHLEAQGKHTFRYLGWVFNGTDCEIAVEDGRVTAVRVVSLED